MSALPDGYSACHALIGNAISRCRQYDESRHRITISIKKCESHSSSCLLTSFQVSISDTGRGISSKGISKLYEEYPCSYKTNLSSIPLFWDGKLVIMTTEFKEDAMRNYQVDDAFCKPTILQLRSLPKECVHICGTNIVMDLKGYPEKLLLYVQDIFGKMEILMLKNIAIELVIVGTMIDGTLSENVMLMTSGLSLPLELSNLERLAVGLVKHTCNPTDRQAPGSSAPCKVGKAAVKSLDMANETTIEVCIVVTEIPDCDSDPVSTRELQTKVLFFQDFLCVNSVSSVMQSLRRKVNWENFGLHVKDISYDDLGTTIIHWECASRLDNIAVAIHRYGNKQRRKQMEKSREMSLYRKAVENALNDLKQQNPDLFLSHDSRELHKYVPDFSKCISRIISSSLDVSFKMACANILCLQSPDATNLETKIGERVFRAIENSEKLAAEDSFFQKKKKKKKNRDTKSENKEESNQFTEEDEYENDAGDDESSGMASIWDYL